MTLEQSTARIRDLALDDLDAASRAVSDRARAVVEFAALADPQALLDARAAGDALLAQLLDERRRLLAELRNARSMRDCLSANLQPDQSRSSFLA